MFPHQLTRKRGALHLFFVLVLAAQLPCLAESDRSSLRKPNVVVIVVDDLGWTDIGCYGSSFYETPNLDRFAGTAIRFTDAYSTCPVCSPSRVSIMTGRYPQRSGVTDYLGAPQPANWNRPTPLLPAPHARQLELEELTMAELVRDAGYQTFFAGKWHLGPEPYYPQHQGFGINIGGCHWGHPAEGGRFFSPYENPSMTDGPDGEYLPMRLAGETSSFIRKNRDKPFFAVLSFYVVHTPLMTLPELSRKYDQKKESIEPDGPLFIERDGRKVRQIQEHSVYAGMVEAMDAAVGMVIQTLDQEGLANDTMVIFTSDNGGLSTSEGHPTSNLPLRAGKGWMYEGGIRVPLMVRAPGRTPSAGITISTPVNGNDIVPTILDYASIPAPDSIDGLSVLTLASDPDRGEDRPLFWHYPHYGNQGGSPAAAVRRGDWKLIRFFGNDRESDNFELYHLATDIGEDHNRFTDEPEIGLELQRLLESWSREVGVLYPDPRVKQDK